MAALDECCGHWRFNDSCVWIYFQSVTDLIFTFLMLYNFLFALTWFRVHIPFWDHSLLYIMNRFLDLFILVAVSTLRTSCASSFWTSFVNVSRVFGIFLNATFRSLILQFVIFICTLSLYLYLLLFYLDCSFLCVYISSCDLTSYLPSMSA